MLKFNLEAKSEGVNGKTGRVRVKGGFGGHDLKLT
jgi:hypothetical protein